MIRRKSQLYPTSLLCIFIVGLVCLSNMFVILAAESAVISVGQATAAQGERVTVEVMLDTNPGLAYLRLTIDYDTSRLRIDNIGSVSHGDALPRLSFTGLTAVTYSQSPFRVLWFGTASDRTTGILLNIAFTVLENATPGEAFVNVSVDEQDANDRDGVRVAVTAASGNVTVLAEETTQPTPPPNDADPAVPTYPPDDEQPPQNETVLPPENDSPSEENGQPPQAEEATPEDETPPTPTPTPPPTPSVPRVTIAPFIPPASEYNITVDDGVITIAPSLDVSDAENNVGTRLTSPVTLDVPLEEAEINHYRLVAASEAGTILGGRYNPDTGMFSLVAEYTGAFVISYMENLNRFNLQIGTNVILDLAGNTPDILMDVVPVIIDGRTLIPVRFMANALGAQVGWNGDSREVTLTLDGVPLTFAVDGQLTPQLISLGMDVPAQIVESRTIVPLRFIGEFFGAIVSWEGSTRTVEVIWHP